MRESPSRHLHAIAGKLGRKFRIEGSELSEREDWLYDQCISELEYRRRRRGWAGCSCELCIPPFPD